MSRHKLTKTSKYKMIHGENIRIYSPVAVNTSVVPGLYHFTIGEVIINDDIEVKIKFNGTWNCR